MGLRFDRAPLEDLYAHFRQQALARQDVHAGILATLCCLAWLGRLARSGRPCGGQNSRRPAEHERTDPDAVLHAALVLWRGQHWYTRRRTRIVLALRLLHLAMAAGLHSNLDRLLVSSGVEPAWRTLGRLLVACRFVPLLISCLGFQATPGVSMILQAGSVVFVLQHARDACASPFMQQPGPQRSLASVFRWLGGIRPSLTPSPMPAVDLPPGADPCLPLAVWILGCWLFLLPVLLVALMDARARQAFVLSLPTGTLPAAERAWWLAVCLPPPCLAALLGMPPLALALWRFGALALEAAFAKGG